MSEEQRKVGRPRHPDPDYKIKYQEQYRNTLLDCMCGTKIKKGSWYHHQRSRLHEWLSEAQKQSKIGEMPKGVVFG